MKRLKRKFDKTFSFGTTVMEKIALGFQYVFSDSNANYEFLTEDQHDLTAQNIDEDSDSKFDYALSDLYLPKEELYFGQQLLYPSFLHDYRPSVSKKGLFDQNIIQSKELNCPKNSNIRSIEDRNSVVTVKNRHFAASGHQNTSENNSSFTRLCNDNSKLPPLLSDINSDPKNNGPYYFKDNIPFVSDKDIVLLRKESKILESVQKATNNQISSGNETLEYKDASFASKNLADHYFFEDFKSFLESREVHNVSLNMPTYFRENMDLLQRERNSHINTYRDNIVPYQIITPSVNALNKHANEISKQRYTIKCQISHFLKGIFDFVRIICAKINSGDLLLYEDNISFLLLRKKVTDFIAFILKYISRQEQETLLFLLRSLISKIAFPKLNSCTYQASENCLYFPKYSEINNSINLNKHEEVTEGFNPDWLDFNWNMPNLQTSIVFENENKRRILHEAENLNILNSVSEMNNKLYLTHNHNSSVENAEISITDNSSQINNNPHLTQKSPTKILNVVFNNSKFSKSMFETGVHERRYKKRKETLSFNNLKSMNSDKHNGVKTCQIGNKDDALSDDSALKLTNTDNFSQNPNSSGITDYIVNICDDISLEGKSDDGAITGESSHSGSKFTKSLKQKCSDCIVILKDCNCNESEQINKKSNSSTDSRSEAPLPAVSKEENISRENRGRKRQNSSPVVEKFPNKRVKTGNEKKERNITLIDQQVPGLRRSCRLLSKPKASSCESRSTSSEIHYKSLKKDSKHDEEETFSSKCSETCSTIPINEEKSSLKPRKQKVSKTRKSSPIVISSSQSNTFYSTDGNSCFQFSKIIQGVYKNPPSRKKLTKFAFDERERFIRKGGQPESPKSASENKMLKTSFSNLDGLESMYSSPLYHFENRNSGSKSLKRKHDFNEKTLKSRKISDSKAVVKFSNDLLYPKIIGDLMYVVQSGKVTIATIDDLCLKPTELSCQQKHKIKIKSLKACKEYKLKKRME